MKSSIIAILSFGLLCATAYAAHDQTTQLSMNDQSQGHAMQTQNQSQGENFLAANKSKPGVVCLHSGLQYKVLVDGKGAHPTANDTVTVQYEGKLVNGKVFDSSYKRGQPATFPVDGVIAGWTEALKLMKVGSTWELYIPPSLAYGERGAPPVIGPNETLVFKVELLDIKNN